MRKRPRQQRSSFTVETILEATTQLLDIEGAEVTTNRIAEKAGVSVGSIYQYFGDKQAIFDELARRHLDDADRAMTAVLDDNPVGSSPWPEVLRAVIEVAVRENSTHGRAHGRLRELADPARLAAGYTALVDTLIARLTAYLVADGWTVESAAVDLRLAFAAVDAQVHQLAGTELTGDELTDRVSAYTEAALRGR
ncbi:MULTISPECIES: TetR/AcrR family transcriptional regulator [Gordonia]|uniref:TetR/AcrR family transcriptional regulator n=2 Tax=Gordonia terrae TaxID=2055 RepID=A0A2I1RAM6_9ACTN|nr:MULTISPECIES: TetR/AcrR family transcriptional regulator [Gordonia]VTR12534.1 TetR family transcriptional regulator [Clostridioides difficile]ANY24884.1 TetR family transcriptional regulator [Gordonia terrae]AWO85633.1 TetR/AcrR family transcriptional regulator [Gordonia terrae]MCG7635182.1 TetR/AcrR family transcriptional regulator [Gordonia sp. McavH-238-E]PKZ66190.1 TetR/AcrR family transcriptional regulator [Gordonia terrae]